MNKIVKITWGFLLCPVMLFAQEVEMADTMRANGKIYVVVSIILVIVLGLVGYLVSIDRKVSRLEKQMDNVKQKI